MNKTQIITGITILGITGLAFAGVLNTTPQPIEVDGQTPKNYFEAIQEQVTKLELNESKTKEQEQAIKQAEANISILIERREEINQELKKATEECLENEECKTLLETSKKSLETLN